MNNSILCGLDEAGRGPLAGPVSAGAVILPPDFPFDVLNDSKQLSEKKREKAELIIKEKSCWGIGFVDHDIIDKINILQASLRAMKVAFEMMMIKFPEWVLQNQLDKNIWKVENIVALADGIYCPKIVSPCTCEVKADGKYPEVMAASIIAKVGRDRLMKEYDALYPEYGYAKHKGYPTPSHKAICRELGPSPIQRLTFKY